MRRLPWRDRSGTALAGLALVAMLLLGLAACGLLEPDGNTATLEIDTSDGSSVRVITALDFRVAVDQDGRETFDLRDADTTWVEPLYRRSFDIAETGRFYARAVEAEDSTAVVSMRVLIDGDQSFFREAILTGRGTQYYYAGR